MQKRQNMNTISIDSRQKTLILMLIVSVVFHLVFLWLLHKNQWLFFTPEKIQKSRPEEVTIVFPENKEADKVRKIVENRNANNLRPEKSDLISDRNSRAADRKSLPRKGSLPASSGNSELANLSLRQSVLSRRSSSGKTFSKKALVGETTRQPNLLAQKEAAVLSAMQENEGSGENLNQKDFSALEVGGLTLSSYQWNWAPYVIAMKRKLAHVWVPPAAWYMGLIHGATVIKFTIDRQGKIIGMRVLKHKGHNSLKISSTRAIESLFPFLPLPEDFPEETLTIIAELIYQNLSQER